MIGTWKSIAERSYWIQVLNEMGYEGSGIWSCQWMYPIHEPFMASEEALRKRFRKVS